jgi:hypothetical protein
MPPGAVYPPLPSSVQGKVICFCWIVGVGYRWACIDPSLSVGGGPAQPPAHVSGEPAPTPAPKR